MHIHAFAYSPRPFTEAATLDGQIPEETKKTRNAAVIAVSDLNKEETAAALAGHCVEILVEKNSSGVSYGHTEGFMEAKIPSCIKKAGAYVKCVVTSYDKTDKMLVCTEI
jgi:tRNA A37 methylthiotransferase MiaB